VTVTFDTNAVLDVLLAREPDLEAASKLFALVDNACIDGAICATTVTTIFSIASKDFGQRRAREQVRALLGLFTVAAVDRGVLDGALATAFADYEDAVLHEAARVAGSAVIVTRDRVGFAASSLPAMSPQELLAVVAAAQ